MKKKRTKLIKPVVVGFAVVYLAIMLLSTYLVKVQFKNDFDNTLKETLSNFQRTIYEKEGESAGTWDDAEKRIWYQSVANAYLLYNKEFIKLSLAVYDETGALLAKSENTIGASKNSMDEWDKSIFPHDFPEQTDLSEWSYAGAAEESSSWLRTSSVVRLGCEPDSEFNRYIEAHMESYPWLAAFAHMKYLYAAGFVLILACMIKIIYSANRLYDQQEALEETRRDFINAIAHELKTPLGIIRNFAENLLEHTMEEKRDYYLTQIVGQTEEMDRLAGEMILVSRMDSENLVLQRETVSFDELIWEQLNRLKPVIEEKKLEVELQKEQDFRLEGDKDYLAKAVWNLLSNAAAYNVPEGRILITLKEKSCAIENTGFPLSEEQLKRSFELFYSGNKSRSAKDGKHMGMGLYLAEKIFSRHGLSVALENTKIGVKATISADNK